jgi:hypothetical protein
MTKNCTKSNNNTYPILTKDFEIFLRLSALILLHVEDNFVTVIDFGFGVISSVACWIQYLSTCYNASHTYAASLPHCINYHIVHS